jgi:hypothetical protein
MVDAPSIISARGRLATNSLPLLNNAIAFSMNDAVSSSEGFSIFLMSSS